MTMSLWFKRKCIYPTCKEKADKKTVKSKDMLL